MEFTNQPYEKISPVLFLIIIKITRAHWNCNTPGLFNALATSCCYQTHPRRCFNWFGLVVIWDSFLNLLMKLSPRSFFIDNVFLFKTLIWNNLSQFGINLQWKVNIYYCPIYYLIYWAFTTASEPIRCSIC